MGLGSGGCPGLSQALAAEVASRCADEGGFDAVTLDEHGVMLFFRGDHVWKGFHGPAQLINATWPEIQGPVDAALRIHHKEAPGVHDSVYLFQGSKVYIYRVGQGYTLVQGYPRGLEEELGITGADATFTCPHSAELFVIKGVGRARPGEKGSEV
ncbi:Hemopexin [Chelonia mydas]|uniref:Hemopexin n=1 Tax=Chelonia mydas TaxID=8469 RepID=M7BPC3_CHEMY|nr:Hemopexin [Chelonia mydas]